MIKKDNKRREKIKIRVLKKIKGKTDKPLLTVYRSLKHIYGQIVDLKTGKTLLTVSSKSKELTQELNNLKQKNRKKQRSWQTISKKSNRFKY